MHKVVLVDDEIFARQGMNKLIDWETCGYQVVGEADDGEDALKLIEQLQPDLVITDIRMPILDGLGLIKHVVESADNHVPSFIIVSGYDDFNYAQQAVRYGVHDFIIKPIDENELQITLKRLSLKLQQEKLMKAKKEDERKGEIITSLIKGEADALVIVEWAKRLDVALDIEMYYVLVEVNDVHLWQGKHPDLTVEHIEKYINQGINRVIQKDKFLYKHRQQMGFILSIDDLQYYQGNLERFIMRLQHELFKLFELPIYIYVGKQVNHLMQLADSFRTAKDALLYKFIEDEKKVVIYENVRHKSLHHIDIDNSVYQKLFEHIEESNFEETKKMVDQIFDNFQKNYYVPEAIKLTIHRCVTGIAKIIKSMDSSEQELKSFDPIVSWQDLNLTLGELKNIFLDFTIESGQILSNCRQNCNKGGIQKVKSYIEANYKKNVSLKSIASEFYMNPVYLGQLFKKNYGIYFNDFLLQLRIHEAKKLLRQTDMRIYEVAESIGFNNADYFVTQFEKVEKLTPTEYRNKLLK